MIMHMTLGSNDLETSAAFYDGVMPTLNHARAPISLEGFLAYVPTENAYGGDTDANARKSPFLCVCTPYDGKPASAGNGFHIAWVATSKASVRDFHAAALANGGSDEGGPDYRPQYSPDYFAAYVRDPDGNKLQAVFHENGRSTGAGGDVLSHITLPVDDLEAGLAFYEPVFATLGIGRSRDSETAGEDGAFSLDGVIRPMVFVQRPFNDQPAVYGNGQHVSFFAETRAQVDRFFETAMALGAQDDGPPGVRAAYSQPYYAAYVRGPAGTKLQAVCKTGK